MDFRRLVAILRRFWASVLVVLVLTVVAVLLVPSNISPDYEARGSAILLSPSTVSSDTGEDVGVNPWSRFGGSGEGVAATAMIEVLGSEAAEDVVLEDEAVKEYEVGANPGGNGAILDISVRASNEESALAAFDLIVARLDRELQTRQAASGAPPETWLVSEVLTRPTDAIELRGSQTRAMLAVAALGVVASAAVAVALDAVAGARRRRRVDVDEHVEGDGPATPPSEGVDSEEGSDGATSTLTQRDAGDASERDASRVSPGDRR